MPLLLKIIFASLITGLLGLAGGGLTLLWKTEWVKKFSLHLISFAIGVLLATATLDLLPESIELAGKNIEGLFIGLLAGIVGFFGLERLIFKFHPHHHEDDELAGAEAHHHVAPVLLLVGDTVHNFIDGILIAVTFLANPALGLLTAVAVAAHEIPQEISDFSIMLFHGWSRKKVVWANIFSAFSSLVGAIAAFAFRDLIFPYIPQLLAFTAGVFIYIAVADLIPDVSQKTGSDKISHILVLLLLGIASVWILGIYLEAH